MLRHRIVGYRFFVDPRLTVPAFEREARPRAVRRALDLARRRFVLRLLILCTDARLAGFFFGVREFDVSGSVASLRVILASVPAA